MMLLILLASVLIAAVTVYQYKEQTIEYNTGRLERKEDAVKSAIHIWLNDSNNSSPITTKNLAFIFKEKIHEISSIHKLEVNIYDLKGVLLKSSYSGFVKNVIPKKLSGNTVKSLASSPLHRLVNLTKVEDKKRQSSFTYIVDNKFKPIGILNLRYFQDNTSQEKDLEEFLVRMAFVYLLMFILAIGLAYFISRYITKSLKMVTEKMYLTSLSERNEKIILRNASTEIHTLVNAYNKMIDALEESAVKLAKGEREQAWREMAKQVAHEIKNPLTPMRLTVQSFQRKFDPSDPLIHEKLNEHSQTLIQQIDTLSSIASAFSNFANMPKQQREKMDIVEVLKHSLDIFPEDYIRFYPKEKSIIAELDKSQIIRIITNLVKNATQALEDTKDKKIEVRIFKKDGHVTFTVADNGRGISEEVKNRVFEPKFTTKSSGMGLGLPMVKNIVNAFDGHISFTSQENKGTVFTVSLPIK
ncbi:MAG: GHKL domain-containing protein [Flavobacteriaceae bacterium]|nr:GHKL domain-containing protein [Flavobacteriaceae bacterium]